MEMGRWQWRPPPEVTIAPRRHPRQMSIGRTSVFCWKLSLSLLVALREEQHQANSRDTKSSEPNGRVDHS
jgi:hypothetical protein